MSRTTFIVDCTLIPNQRENIENKLVEILKEVKFKYEILSLPISPTKEAAFSVREGIKYVFVDPALSVARRWNVLRQHAAEDSKSLVFISTDNFDLDLLRYRLELFQVDPTVGITGELVTPLPFDRQVFWTKLSTEIFVPEEVFYEKCYIGDSPIVVGNSLWATQVSTWDKIGGMPLKSSAPFLEYNFRALLLDYKVITQ